MSAVAMASVALLVALVAFALAMLALGLARAAAKPVPVMVGPRVGPDLEQGRPRPGAWVADDSVSGALSGVPSGRCPTCSGPVRETVDMVCPTCHTDYAPWNAPPSPSLSTAPTPVSPVDVTEARRAWLDGASPEAVGALMSLGRGARIVGVEVENAMQVEQDAQAEDLGLEAKCALHLQLEELSEDAGDHVEALGARAGGEARAKARGEGLDVSLHLLGDRVRGDLTDRHVASPSVGQVAGGAAPAVGAPGVPAPGAGVPTVGDPADTPVVPSAAGAVAGGPVGGLATPAGSPTATFAEQYGSQVFVVLNRHHTVSSVCASEVVARARAEAVRGWVQPVALDGRWPA